MSFMLLVVLICSYIYTIITYIKVVKLQSKDTCKTNKPEQREYKNIAKNKY
jgi:hypothetical protein